MIEIVKKYPIGAKVRLTGNMMNEETRTVQGYKQIGGTKYLIFSEGDSVCVKRVMDENEGKQIEECGNGWIPCSERFPENEKEVEITYTEKHYKTGETLYLTARAFHEDGTLTVDDSALWWENVDEFEYDEETDSYTIPEGWFESVSFAETFEKIDAPVIAWRYTTPPYRIS